MLFVTDKLAAGVDEVGRGCLAGPVVAAAVIMPYEFEDEHLQWVEKVKDSKKIGKETRNNLSDFIKEVAIDYSISFVDNTIIDEMNIRNAKFLHNSGSR